MKNYYYLAAALVLASCSSDEFIGDSSSVQNENGNGMITFSQGVKKMTRAQSTGEAAAALLNNNFVLLGTKGSTSPVTVFDNYNVGYTPNSANTTESNTANWDYVGLTSLNGATQNIKYWDYSADQYAFIAYSGGTVSNSGKINYAGAFDPTVGAYKFTDAPYIADLVKVAPADYGKQVTLTFKSAGTKVNIGFFEVIPGYSVQDIEFWDGNPTYDYPVADMSAVANGSSVAAYYVDDTSNPGSYIPATGTYDNTAGITYYNKVMVGASVQSKAMLKSASNNIIHSTEQIVYFNNATGEAIVTGGSSSTKDDVLSFNALSIPAAGIGTTAATATKVGTNVTPNPGTASSLTLRVNYTLKALDGDETIKVYGATAVVPAQYTDWKTNYSYTYLFKISNNTNGSTGGVHINDNGTPGDPSDDYPEPEDPEGLFPITFDAVVEAEVDGVQESITTVATPSITTYQDGIVNGANYVTTEVIEIMAVKDGALVDLSGAALYKLSDAATEAEVMDALNVPDPAYSGSDIKGRNGLVLTNATSKLDVTDATKVLIKSGIAAGTYAIVHTISAPSAGAPKEKYVPVSLTAGDSLDGYYTYDGADYNACVSSDKAVAGEYYYTKLLVSDGKYAVKVIKIQ